MGPGGRGAFGIGARWSARARGGKGLFGWPGGLLGVGLTLLVVSCGPPRKPYPEALQSERPGERIRAIKQAAELGDQSVIGILVDRLEDEDEAVRFYAILALEKLTGTRLGYDYSASAGERWRAVQRWREHLTRSAGPDGQADTGGDP